MSLTTGGLTLPRRGSLVAGGLTLSDFVGGGLVEVDGATALLTWTAYPGTPSGGSLSATGATATVTWLAHVGAVTISSLGPPATIIVQADPSRKRASFYS